MIASLTFNTIKSFYVRKYHLPTTNRKRKEKKPKIEQNTQDMTWHLYTHIIPTFATLIHSTIIKHVLL